MAMGVRSRRRRGEIVCKLAGEKGKGEYQARRRRSTRPNQHHRSPFDGTSFRARAFHFLRYNNELTGAITP